MKEEDKLLKKIGKSNPYTVPEGYFEKFASELMDKLPEQEQPQFEPVKITTWQRIKPWCYMAAMFIGAALIIRVASYKPNPFEDNAVAIEADSEMYDTYIDYAVNQSLMDDYSLYIYLTEATAE